MASQERRAAFFWRGVSAFRNATDKVTDLYRCPICLRPFSIQALEDRRLTEEHVPPQSQGGSVLTLTCKTCNDRAGHMIDAQVSRRERLNRFTRGLVGLEEGPVSEWALIDMGGVETRAEVEIADGTVTAYGKPGHSPPGAPERQRDYLAQAAKQDSEDASFKLTPLVEFHPERSKVGDLKSAYLLAFAGLGYRYIFQDDVDKVRNQIRNPGHDIIEGYWHHQGHDAEARERVFEVEEPFRAIVVQLGRILVFLPPLNSSGRFYQSLTGRESGQIDFQGYSWAWPRTFRLSLDFASGSAVSGRFRYAPCDLTRLRIRWPSDFALEERYSSLFESAE